MKKAWALGSIVIGGMLVAVAWAKFGAGELTINGKSVPTNFIVDSGRTYVPLSDVAKVLGGNVQRTADGYSIVAGGGTMVSGTQGAIGQTLVGNGIQFTVLSMSAGDHYQRHFGSGTLDADGPANNVVALICRMRNTSSKTISPNFTGTDKTALADTEEHTYPPYTLGYKDVPSNSDILPGATVDFALTFSVPKSATLKALVYDTDGLPKKSTFRVTLTPPPSK